jgi:hypothetical protein
MKLLFDCDYTTLEDALDQIKRDYSDAIIITQYSHGGYYCEDCGDNHYGTQVEFSTESEVIMDNYTKII